MLEEKGTVLKAGRRENSYQGGNFYKMNPHSTALPGLQKRLIKRILWGCHIGAEGKIVW